MRLTAITADRHVFEGRVNGKPLGFLLAFDGAAAVRLSIAGDGASMLLDELPLLGPVEMGELGSIEVEEMALALDPRLAGAQVDEVRTLHLGGRRVGVRLLLSGGDEFNFWVDDDEYWWGDAAALAAHDWLDCGRPTAGGPVQL